MMTRLILLFGSLIMLSGCAMTDEESMNTLNQIGAIEQANTGHYHIQPVNGYHPDAYGLGLHADEFGRSFRWVDQSTGQAIAPNTSVTPNGYGLGVGADEFGRAVVAAY